MQPQLLPTIDFPVHQLPVFFPRRKSLHLHFYTSGICAVLDRYQPDIVFVDEEPWSLVAAQTAGLCTRRKIPFVNYTKQNLVKRYPLPFSWIEKTIYRDASAIVALSDDAKSVLRAKGFTGKIPILAHGCDLSLFYPETNLTLRRELGLSKMVIGYFGRIVPEKGLETLIKAVEFLSKKHDFQVLMVGSGPQEKYLRQCIAKAGLQKRFVWTGYIPHNQAGNYMRCMDVLVLPSLTTTNWKEQFGRVLIESMACQVPVIGSNSGQIPELIHDTGGGLVFKEGDSADLANKLARLINDKKLRSELGKAGATAVAHRYTHDAIALKLLEIFQDVCSTPSLVLS